MNESVKGCCPGKQGGGVVYVRKETSLLVGRGGKKTGWLEEGGKKWKEKKHAQLLLDELVA